MDGVFVPRFGIYPEIIQDLARTTEYTLDVHLMVNDVSFAISQLDKNFSIDTISFHYFTNEGRVLSLVDKIKELGAKPVIAVDLSTNVEDLYPLVESGEIEGLLFMGIHPGVLKQQHRPEIAIQKITKLKNELALPANFIIQIDGGFNFDTASDLLKAGVNSFVGGTSTIFSRVETAQNEDEKLQLVRKNIKTIRNALDNG